MEAAKASVKKIIGKDGKHDTTVHESVAPAVQNENITRTQHEKIIPAVDREVHQTHYHTTEQPVQHREVLPEQHHHTEVPVESRAFDHSNEADIKRSLESERAKYRDTQTRAEGEKTRSTEAAIAGEHVHHHVHETIQPVVHKETLEPHVIHKTVPIHEVHHNQAQHHSAHALPPVSMDEFKQQGGSLKGREERHDFFPGEPKSFPGESGRTTGTTNGTTTSPGTGTSTMGLDGRGAEPKTSNINPSRLDHGTTTNTTTSTNTNTTSSSKPGLMDKLNPSKDTDGDGKAGIMK